MLVETRRKRGLTQLQAAEQMGMKNVDLCRWEKGRVTPSLKSLPRIVAWLER